MPLAKKKAAAKQRLLKKEPASFTTPPYEPEPEQSLDGKSPWGGSPPLDWKGAASPATLSAAAEAARSALWRRSAAAAGGGLNGSNGLKTLLSKTLLLTLRDRAR